VVNGEHVLVADSDHDLAEATRRVLTDDELATRLARNARQLVEQRFDWSRCAAPMLALHADLLTGSGR
jgi:glycosyltransferase involved in cell wall biosynthesis